MECKLTTKHQEIIKGVVVIGSGLASVASIWGVIAANPEKRIVVLDVGITSPIGDPSRNSDLDASGNRSSNSLDSNKSFSKLLRIPKKTLQGTDYFSRHDESLLRITAQGITPPLSHALGGLAAGWGAAVLPLATIDYKRWLLPNNFLEEFYGKVLQLVPYSCVADDLLELFPVMTPSRDVIRIGPDERSLLSRLEKGKSKTFVAGQSRLLVDASTSGCTYCKRCMSGCEIGAIFSPAKEIRELVQSNKIEYRPRSFVKSIEPQESNVLIRFQIEGEEKTLQCERVFLAAGATGSAQILCCSSIFGISGCELKTRGGYMVPMLNLFRFGSKREENANTLSSIFIEQRAKGFIGFIHTQLSLNNELVDDAINKLGFKLLRQLLVRLRPLICVGLINFSSHHSGRFQMKVEHDVERKATHLLTEYDEIRPNRRYLLRFLLLSTIKYLRSGLVPIWIFAKRNSGSYHVGGSFPMRVNPSRGETDLDGRLNEVDRVHLVDLSVFPDIPGTTVGLTEMANAYRIGFQVVSTRD